MNKEDWIKQIKKRTVTLAEDQVELRPYTGIMYKVKSQSKDILTTNSYIKQLISLKH